jgi:hypothetical protein
MRPLFCPVFFTDSLEAQFSRRYFGFIAGQQSYITVALTFNLQCSSSTQGNLRHFGVVNKWLRQIHTSAGLNQAALLTEPAGHGWQRVSWLDKQLARPHR